MTRSQKRGTHKSHRRSQCSDQSILSRTIIRSNPGTASNNGAAAGPHATVIFASRLFSITRCKSPVDKIASPTRVDVTNKSFMPSILSPI